MVACVGPHGLGRSRAPCLPSGRLTATPPAVCRFPDSPRRTRRATFTAPGSPGLSIPRSTLPSGPYPVSPSPLSRRLHADSGSWLLRVALPLVPFALWPAFPASDYYGTSDAAQVSLPDCWGHLFQGSLSCSCKWTLQDRLGNGLLCATQSALCGIPNVGRVSQVYLLNPLG